MSLKRLAVISFILIAPSLAQAEGDKIGNGAPAKGASQSRELSFVTGCATINGKTTCIDPFNSANPSNLYLHSYVNDVCNLGISPHVDFQAYVTEGPQGRRITVSTLSMSMSIGLTSDNKTCTDADTCSRTFYDQGCRQSCIVASMTADGAQTTTDRTCSE